MDTRSTAQEVAPNDFRWLEGVQLSAKQKQRRRPGFGKLLGDQSPYNNQDLHNQLFGVTPQPITMLFEAVSTTGSHAMLAGTQNRIYAPAPGKGTYRVISNLLGGTPGVSCSASRFEAAQVDDVVTITNAFDSPVYWIFDQPPDGNNQSVSTIDDLVAIGVTKVGTVYSWKGVMFLGNVVMDGLSAPNRIVWGDLEKPLSYVPSSKSIAGYHDLDPNEIILRFKVLNNTLLCYTNRSIWQIDITGGADVFTFTQRYKEGDSGEGCLAYRNAFISTGDSHYYMGRDGVYRFDAYTSKPVRDDWLHKATNLIFDNLNAAACLSHVAGYNPATREIWFSFSEGNSDCPKRTLIVDVERQFASVMERGFTSFVNSTPNDSGSTRSFLISNCICTASELADSDADTSLIEGGFCTPQPTDSPCTARPDCVWTNTTRLLEDGTLTEDWDAPMSPTSVAASLVGVTFQTLCGPEQQKLSCNPKQVFVMASADDFCLKEVNEQSPIYAHEMCVNKTQCGTYSLVGYKTTWRSGPLDLKSPSEEKTVRRLLVEAYPAMQTIPSSIFLKVGGSYSAGDPNDPSTSCPITYQAPATKLLICPATKTSDQYASSNTRPGKGLEWPVFQKGRFIYWELSIDGTGGKCDLSSVSMEVALAATLKY